MIHGDFRGAKAITLENDQLRAVMLPDHGGKIASLYHRERRFELLFQNPKPSFAPAKAGDDFASHEACGFDDVFPAVIAEETGGRRPPGRLPRPWGTVVGRHGGPGGGNGCQPAV